MDAIPPTYLTGDFKIARIGFERVGTATGGCDLEIRASALLSDDPTPVLIPHSTIDGYATITCAGGGTEVLGDINGDNRLDTGDVRWLAIYVASSGNDPTYRPLYANGDINNDGLLNMGDVRYLAIYVASNGNDPTYSPLYPPKP
jgi:hypothetical protein